MNNAPWKKLYEAGSRAVERSADAIAIVHLQHALELIDRVPDADQRTALERKIRARLHGERD